MKWIIKLSFVVFLLSSCGVSFFVKKEKVLQTDRGFLLLSSKGDYFMPSKIDTTLNSKENFLAKKFYKKGFAVNVNIYDRAYLLKIYSETLNDHIYVIPVEIDYLINNNLPPNIKKSLKSYYNFDIYLKSDSVINCQVNNMSNTIVIIHPYMSSYSLFRLENLYLDKEQR